LRDPEESFAEILHLDGGAFSGWNLVGRVALIAGKAGVLAFQQISGLFVIELIGVPFNKRETHAVVIGVTTDALLAGTRRYVIGAVQATLGGHARADVGVAADASELRLTSSDLVAVRAVSRAVEKLMRARERSGRDLRAGVPREKSRKEEEN
jgi:hypothetical protein